MSLSPSIHHQPQTYCQAWYSAVDVPISPLQKRRAFSQCSLSNGRLSFFKTQNGNMPGPLCGLRSQWSLGPIQKHQLCKKPVSKLMMALSRCRIFFSVVEEMGCLDCGDKMFTKDKNTGLGMMNDVAPVWLYHLLFCSFGQVVEPL